MNEEILGIFPGWIRDKSSKWITKGWTLKLVFTSNRLIAADVKRRTGAPQFVGDPHYISYHASECDRLKMEQVSAESMLRSNAENYQIAYSDIAAIELKSPLIESHRDLLIFTTENLDVPKYTFSVMIKSRYAHVFEEFLRAVLPGKM